MPVELSIVESVTELETTVVTVVLESASAPGPAGPGVPAGGTANQVLTKDSGTDYDTSWQDAAAGGASALVDLTDVTGEPPSTGEAPVWDGDSFELTDVATQAELDAHAADTTNQHGIADTSALALTANHPSNATFNDHSARHENGGADEISIAGLDGTPTELTNHLNDAADAHDASAISVADAGTFYTATDVEGVLQEIAPQLGSASGELLERDVNQTAHGLAVGNIVRHNGTAYVKAQANSAANAEVVGIVSAVADVNNFTLHYGGHLTGLSGLTAGTVYYLDDDTSGLLTATEPADLGDVSKPVLIADTTTSGYFFNFRGAVVVADGGSVAADDENLIVHMEVFA